MPVVWSLIGRKILHACAFWRRPARGHEAESRAAAWLMRTHGMQLLARNWRYKHGEIDLILRDGEVLVFVEVRLRAAQSRVSAAFSLGPHKRKVLRRTCLAYLRQVQPRPERVRLDLVAWTDPGAGKPWEIHYRRGLGFLKL